MVEVTVATYGFRDEAEVSRAHLASLGIVARIAVDHEGGLNPGFFADYAVRLIVMEEDAVAARRALAEPS